MKSLKRYQNLRYKMEIEFSPDEKAYFVNFPELPGCMADGKTPNEAVRKAEKVKNKWLEIAINEGWTIPEPYTKIETSGRLTLRLPKYLHGKVIDRAEQEGVSQNQLIIAYVSEGLERSATNPKINELEHEINLMKTQFETTPIKYAVTSPVLAVTAGDALQTITWNPPPKKPRGSFSGGLYIADEQKLNS